MQNKKLGLCTINIRVAGTLHTISVEEARVLLSTLENLLGSTSPPVYPMPLYDPMWQKLGPDPTKYPVLPPTITCSMPIAQESKNYPTWVF